MEKVLNSFLNEHKYSFNDYFISYLDKKVVNREDYKTVYDKKDEIFDKYEKIRALIEDGKPTTLNQEEADVCIELVSIIDELHTIELLEAFKLGAKEAYIFFEEQDMLNI